MKIIQGIIGVIMVLAFGLFLILIALGLSPNEYIILRGLFFLIVLDVIYLISRIKFIW